MVNYYCSILFLLKKYNECEAYLIKWIQLFFQVDHGLGAANLLKLLGSIQLLEKQSDFAVKLYGELNTLFKCLECLIGEALATYSVGYIKLKGNEFGGAKAKLRAALKSYKHLNHMYGQIFVLRGLIQISNAMKNKRDKKAYQDKLSELEKIRKREKNKQKVMTKNGMFVLRNNGSNVSLMIEPCFKTNVKSKGHRARRVQTSVQKLKMIFQEYLELKDDENRVREYEETWDEVLMLDGQGDVEEEKEVEKEEKEEKVMLKREMSKEMELKY